MRRCRWLGYLIAVLGTAAKLSAQDAAPPSAGLLLKHCLVTAVDDVQVPALRPGLLKSLNVREGAHVAPSDVVAQLDDAEAQMQLRSAAAERDAAATRAKSDLESRYATATHSVAVTEHKISVFVNEKQPNAVSLIELERLRLTAEQAALKVDLSQFEQAVLRTETGVTQAKTELAEHDVKQRQIRAPLGGDVAEIYVQNGEWVEAGKPVLRIVRLDRLRVEGFVHVQSALPGEIVGRAVKVRVELARGEWHEFSGKITFVSPLVQAGGEYRVWAEVDNRRVQEQWLLRPGLEAEMTLENR
jgi:multidrug resistance efflux pump